MNPKQLLSYTNCIAWMLSLVFLSCKEKAVSPPYFQPTTKDISALFPLYIGNQWAYVDSMDANTRLTIRTVTSYLEEGNWAWWSLDLGGALSELSVINDSVYTRSKQNGLPNPFLSYIPPSPSGDTQFFVRQTLSEDTVFVRPLGHAFNVPAGTFDSVLIYEMNLPLNGRFVQYFRPRVGVLATETYQDTIRRESTHLVYYRLFR